MINRKNTDVDTTFKKIIKRKGPNQSERGGLTVQFPFVFVLV